MNQDTEEFLQFIKDSKAVLIYVSGENCNICKVLRPSVENLIRQNFSKMKLLYVDVNKNPEIAAQLSVFSIPTVICFFEGKEFFRKTRVFGLAELNNEIERPYSMLFENDSRNRSY